MTELQRMRARALTQCTMLPGSPAKQFVAHMAYIADQDRNRWLSAKQAAWVEGLAWEYRDQLKQGGFGHLVPAEKPETGKKFSTAENAQNAEPDLPAKGREN